MRRTQPPMRHESRSTAVQCECGGECVRPLVHRRSRRTTWSTFIYASHLNSVDFTTFPKFCKILYACRLCNLMQSFIWDYYRHRLKRRRSTTDYVDAHLFFFLSVRHSQSAVCARESIKSRMLHTKLQVGCARALANAVNGFHLWRRKFILNFCCRKKRIEKTLGGMKWWCPVCIFNSRFLIAIPRCANNIHYSLQQSTGCCVDAMSAPEWSERSQCSHANEVNCYTS